jgi:hypothetical protein
MPSQEGQRGINPLQISPDGTEYAVTINAEKMPNIWAGMVEDDRVPHHS